MSDEDDADEGYQAGEEFGEREGDAEEEGAGVGCDDGDEEAEYRGFGEGEVVD